MVRPADFKANTQSILVPPILVPPILVPPMHCPPIRATARY
ncbi:MAG: hypothetical protein WD875_17970 [Pirellulales bacterium]